MLIIVIYSTHFIMPLQKSCLSTTALREFFSSSNLGAGGQNRGSWQIDKSAIANKIPLVPKRAIHSLSPKHDVVQVLRNKRKANLPQIHLCHVWLNKNRHKEKVSCAGAVPGQRLQYRLAGSIHSDASKNDRNKTRLLNKSNVSDMFHIYHKKCTA